MTRDNGSLAVPKGVSMEGQNGGLVVRQDVPVRFPARGSVRSHPWLEWSSLPVPETEDDARQHPVSVYLARLAPSGRASQRGNLDRAARVLSNGAHGLWTFGWHHLTYADMAAWKAHVVAAYPSFKTAQNYVIVVRAVLRECRRLGLMSADAFQAATDIEPVRGRVEEPPGRHVKREEIETLFAHLAGLGTVSARRDAAAFAILRSTGIRRAELLALEVVDYDRDESTLLIRHGKGNVKRKVYLPEKARALVEEWLSVRGRAPGFLICPVSTWENVYPRRKLGTSAFGQQFALRVAQAGIKHFSPHSLRRTFAGDLFEAGHDIAKIMKAGGWATPTQCAAYDRRGDQGRREMATAVDL